VLHIADDLQVLSTYLSLCESEVEAFTQVVHTPGSCLECRTAAALHHLHQQDDSVRMFAARQKPLNAQHLHQRATNLATWAAWCVAPDVVSVSCSCRRD